MSWRWAVLALGAASFAQSRSVSILQPRASDECPNTYQTVSGLDFDIHCGTNQPGWDLVPQNGGPTFTTTENAMTNCMDRCATERPLCYGIAFNFVDGTCWFKNSTFTYQTSAASKSNDTHLAVARKTELAPYDTDCPYKNGTTQTNNGLNFTVHCFQDIIGSDYAPWASPALNGLFHASSLQECMNLCTKAQNLCGGVAFNPNMENGYGNCYAKFNITNGFRPTSTNPNNTTNPIIHAAVARLPTIDVPCTDNKVVASENGTGYTLTCNQNRPGNDLVQYHSESIGDCVNTCAQYSLGKCVGVILDTQMVNGYQNCYLKSGVGAPMDGSEGYILALQGGTVSSTSSSKPTGTSSSTATSSSSSGGGSSSKAWIAGPVIGVIAVIGLIGAAFWFLARRKRIAADQNEKVAPMATQGDGSSHQPTSGHSNVAYGPVDAKYQYAGPQAPAHQGDPEPAYEMAAEQNRHEMPAQKYQEPAELPGQSHNVL